MNWLLLAPVLGAKASHGVRMRTQYFRYPRLSLNVSGKSRPLRLVRAVKPAYDDASADIGPCTYPLILLHVLSFQFLSRSTYIRGSFDNDEKKEAARTNTTHYIPGYYDSKLY